SSAVVIAGISATSFVVRNTVEIRTWRNQLTGYLGEGFNQMTTRTTRRAALYLRVSTDKQTVENQDIQLRQAADRRGWEGGEVYHDAGISGTKGRADRPGLDQMLNDASRRHFDIILVWAIDRLGRSLIDLLGTIQHLEAVGVDLYIDQQSIDTSTPM